MFGFSNKPVGTQKHTIRKCAFVPKIEALESREVMSTLGTIQPSIIVHIWRPSSGWILINSLPDTPVRTAALADYGRDGYLSRNDMLDVFSQGSSGYTNLTPTEFSSLQTLVNNAGTVGMPLYVQNLTYKAVNGAHDQLQADLKSLYLDHVSQTVINYFISHENFELARDLRDQVNIDLLGHNHPYATYTNGNGQTVSATYTQVNLPLFSAGGPTYQDVAQGSVGDCWLMSSLAEVAARNPAIIQNMFIDNGDGTFTVQLYAGGPGWDYLTVDKYLPNGGSVFDHPQGNLWAALAEKAYAQENGTGLIGSSNKGVESYQALNGGWPSWALSAITCLSPTSISMSNVATAWQAGSFVVLCTPGSPASSAIVPDHCYAMIGYASGQYTLFNPWGVNGGWLNNVFRPGTVTLDLNGLTNNFDLAAQAGAALPTVSSVSILRGKLQQANNLDSQFAGDKDSVMPMDVDVPLTLGHRIAALDSVFSETELFAA
jgi:hypothetical protein